MTPSTAIALLDRAIARDGEAVTFRRNVAGGQPMTQDARAFFRGYHAEQIADGIDLHDSMGILSPTGLDWTPQKLDDVVVQGWTRKLQNVDAVTVQGVVVRFDLQVR